MTVGVYNVNWFSGNLVRKYPIDSMASCIDDNGNYLLDDIITDINIAFPKSLGDYCYVSSVNITANLVSILISVDSTPIAACCVPRPTYATKYYTLDALYDGVSGLIAIGIDSIDTTGKWRFSDPTSSRILPTCCTIYEQPYVKSLGRINDANPLTGDILLTSETDVELSKDSLYLDGKLKDAIFIGLKLDEDILSKYLTKCDKRTEMDTCDRSYVSSIGGAIPNCSGNISIVSDCEEITVGSLGNGIITISSDKKLDEICRDDNLFDESDSGEGEDQCPYPGEDAPDICPEESDSANTDSLSPLITMSSTLNQSLNYLNLYTSDISVSYGGALYGNGLGCTNADSQPLTFTCQPDAQNSIDVGIITRSSHNLLTLILGTTSVTIRNLSLSINNSESLYLISPNISYHIVFTADKVAIEDENYSVLYEYSIENTLNNPLSVTLSSVTCETIAYD